MDPRLRALDYMKKDNDALFAITPLDLLCSHWLAKLGVGTEIPESEVWDPDMGSCFAAWALMWKHFAKDERIYLNGEDKGFNVGFQLGMQIAAAILKDPLDASLPAMRSALERAVKKYQWYEKEASPRLPTE